MGGGWRRGRYRFHDLAGGEQVNNSILTLVTFAPAIGAVVLMLMPRNARALRWGALLISVFTFVVSLLMPLGYDYGRSGFQFEINRNWIGQSIHYHMGAD